MSEQSMTAESTSPSKQESKNHSQSQPAESTAPTNGWKAVVAASVIAILLAGFALVFVLNAFSQPLQFDSERWKTETCCRARMQADLLKRHPLVGMKKDDVLGLLGQPDPSGTGDSGDKLTYAFAGTDTHLVLTVVDGRVTSVESH